MPSYLKSRAAFLILHGETFLLGSVGSPGANVGRADLHPVAGDIISAGLSREIMGAICSNVLSIINSRLSSGCVPDHFKIHPVFSCCSGSAGLESKDTEICQISPLSVALPSSHPPIPPFHPPLIPQAISQKQQPHFQHPLGHKYWTYLDDADHILVETGAGQVTASGGGR